MKVEDGFQQPRIELPSAYSADPAFQALLERLLPPRVFEPVERELKEFENRLAGRESSCPYALENSLADIDRHGNAGHQRFANSRTGSICRLTPSNLP